MTEIGGNLYNRGEKIVCPKCGNVWGNFDRSEPLHCPTYAGCRCGNNIYLGQPEGYRGRETQIALNPNSLPDEITIPYPSVPEGKERNPNVDTCAVCGEPIRRHKTKGWYHQDGKGIGGRTHSPSPTKHIIETGGRPESLGGDSDD